MKNAQTTSTEQALTKGPRDMPDRGGSKPNAQISADMVPLARTDIPVANLTNKPGMGQVQTDGSTLCNLGRAATMPYGEPNATKPQVSGKRGGKK